jgi:gas vesicle protein
MENHAYDYASEGEYRSSGSNVSLVVAMLFIGLAAGALTALMLAPKTGRQMRRTLRRIYEDAHDAVEDFGEQAGDWFDKSSDWAEKAKGRVARFNKPVSR